MPEIIHTASGMIGGMTPVLQPGEFVFVTTQDAAQEAALAPDALASFREAEGLSLVITAEQAAAAGLKADQPMRCITLNVYSALDGVGLTAAVATALAAGDVPCNMIAAFHHDHAFVPSHLAEEALAALIVLQDRENQRG